MKASDPREFAQQHANLRGDIARIQDSAPFRTSPNRDEQAMLTELRRAIGALSAKLRDHFAFEEEDGGGYMLEVITSRPTLKHQVERLRSDHDAILAALDEMVLSKAKDRSCEELKIRFVQTIRQLRKHEHAEMDILQLAIVHDLGIAD